MKYAVKTYKKDFMSDMKMGLTQEEAIKLAKSLGEKSRGKGVQIFVTWFDKENGKKGFLNSDGKHETTSTPW